MATLREAFMRPSIDKSTTELPAKSSRTKLQEALLENLTAPIDRPRFVLESGACFIAGTLVHTKDGLVAIEKLKVGDLVFSSPENGEGEHAYKRVVNTFVHQDREIIRVVYKVDEEPNKGYTLTSTLDHPFWAEGEGRTAAARLKGDYIGPSKLRCANGPLLSMQRLDMVHATDRSGIGWIDFAGKYENGALWDYNRATLLANGVPYVWDSWDVEGVGRRKGDEVYAKTTVYNIEVEDYHTYFVGKHGIWVHNADCSGVELFAGGEVGTVLPEGPGAHASLPAVAAFPTHVTRACW